MRVLIIKLTSMGDLMHAFPALSDAVENIPGITFDWVVDESFAEVPRWHPAVNRVITTAHRRWKKSFFSSLRKGEFKDLLQQLNREDYDVVIDLQSNLKSAFVSWLRRGPVFGYDKDTCREKPAHWAYHHHFSVPLRQHAIERQRELFSKVFNYERPSSAPNYSVELGTRALPILPVPDKYLVFVHNASWPTKLWSIDYWRLLIQQVSAAGYSVLLPCGSDDEYQRAQMIAKDLSGAIALPKMSLNAMAAIMNNAQAAVCSDTGLAHMAAMISTPSITLYAVTDTVLIGTVGENQQHIVAGSDNNGSMDDISVEQVWQQLAPLL